jgi:hypothetical protein
MKVKTHVKAGQVGSASVTIEANNTVEVSVGSTVTVQIG